MVINTLEKSGYIEEIEKEISILYSLGVESNEIEYLILLKKTREAGLD